MTSVVSTPAELPSQRAGGHGILLAEAAGVWARIAALSFGRPAGQIAVMHRILVGEVEIRGGAFPLRFQLLPAPPPTQSMRQLTGFEAAP